MKMCKCNLIDSSLMTDVDASDDGIENIRQVTYRGIASSRPQTTELLFRVVEEKLPAI